MKHIMNSNTENYKTMNLKTAQSSLYKTNEHRWHLLIPGIQFYGGVSGDGVKRSRSAEGRRLRAVPLLKLDWQYWRKEMGFLGTCFHPYKGVKASTEVAAYNYLQQLTQRVRYCRVVRGTQKIIQQTQEHLSQRAREWTQQWLLAEM